jgi:uracil-DNA glycosylase
LTITTWRNLLQFMGKVGLDKENCFFTNTYMGLLTASSAEGEASGARDINFRTQCIRYLGEQIRVTQPRLILTLGNYVPPVLAELSPDLKTWLKASNVTYLDKLEAGLVYPLAFERVTSPVAVVVLTHPASRNLNVKRRFYKGLLGEEAEQALVKTALELIGEK